MSTEYSHYHRDYDYSYKSSRHSDYRFNKYQNPKEFTSRRTYYEDERDYNDSYKSYDNYDNNRYGYRGYKPRKYQKDTRTCNHGFHLWKTEFSVKNKDQPEVENKPKEEVVPKEVNEGTSECESIGGKSTNYVTEDSRKSLDTLQDVNVVEEMKTTTTTTIDEILEEKVREVNDEENERVVSQETDESDEEKFSNIDLKVEKKLLDNEFDDSSSDDNNEEEEERPIWEDVDTKQVLEDIKKGSDFLSLCPQDIVILNVTENENEYKTQETAEEEDQDEEEESEVEDLNTIFALRVLERGFSRPSLDIKNNTINSNEIYQESAKTDNGLLPIILESPTSSIYNGGCQSAFLPSQYGSQTPVNKPMFKKFTQDYDAPQWYYTGNDRSMQGPFSSRQMDEWYIMSYLPLDLEINLKESKGFRRLRELVDIVNNEGEESLLNKNMNEIVRWFNHYETNENIEKEQEEEEEFYPPGIPISPTKIANAQRKKTLEAQTAGLMQQEKRVLNNNNKECMSASEMGPKRLAAFNVYNQELIESHCKLPRNDSPLNSGISNHSFHNSPVNNPSILPFPTTNNTAVNLNQFKSPSSSTNGQQSQEDFTYAWK